jgi:hypothetical protein
MKLVSSIWMMAAGGGERGRMPTRIPTRAAARV